MKSLVIGSIYVFYVLVAHDKSDESANERNDRDEMVAIKNIQFLTENV